MRAVQFGVYFFAFMLAETIVNDQAARFFAPQMVNVVYAGGIACTGLGCLSYALSKGTTFHTLRREQKSRKHNMRCLFPLFFA